MGSSAGMSSELRIARKRPGDLDQITLAKRRRAVDPLAKDGEAGIIGHDADSPGDVGDAQCIGDRRDVGDVERDDELTARRGIGDVDAHGGRGLARGQPVTYTVSARWTKASISRNGFFCGSSRPTQVKMKASGWNRSALRQRAR